MQVFQAALLAVVLLKGLHGSVNEAHFCRVHGACDVLLGGLCATHTD